MSTWFLETMLGVWKRDLSSPVILYHLCPVEGEPDDCCQQIWLPCHAQWWIVVLLISKLTLAHSFDSQFPGYSRPWHSYPVCYKLSQWWLIKTKLPHHIIWLHNHLHNVIIYHSFDFSINYVDCNRLQQTLPGCARLCISDCLYQINVAKCTFLF